MVAPYQVDRKTQLALKDPVDGEAGAYLSGMLVKSGHREEE